MIILCRLCVSIIMAFFVLEIYARLTTRKISECLILSKKRYIQQYVSFKQSMRNMFKINFKDGEPTQNINEIIISSYNDFEEFIHKTNESTLYVSTNVFMERKLVALERKSVIKLTEIGKEKYKNQIIEKILFMGITTFVFNIFNIKFWRYLLKKIRIRKFKIDLL